MMQFVLDNMWWHLKVHHRVSPAFILLLIFLILSNFSLAQERCGTVPYMNQLRKEGIIKQTDEQFERWLEQRIQSRMQTEQTQRTQSDHYQIPVVVHVIHNGEPVGTGTNISDEQILSQIEVLNNDFNRLNADAANTPALFAPVASSMSIEFIMAKRDPQGLPTTGINRVQGTKTSWTMGDNAVFKALSFWPSQDYLNIWVLRFSGSTIGYAQYPVSSLAGLEEFQNGAASTDGVVVDYTVFGTSDAGSFTLDPNYNKGRTTTHEIGHFFGLRHIWGDASCGTDYVNDTPVQQTSTSNCPSHPATTNCNGPVVKMFQNYMDYTYDACMNLFTAGQVSRMQTILDDPSVPRRNSLLTSPGLLDPNCDVLDAALIALESPGVITCSTSTSPSITIRNQSCSELNSVKVDYSINQGANQSSIITLSPPLGINQTTVVNLPSITPGSGINSISIQLSEVNGQADENPGNGTLSQQFLVDDSEDFIPLREEFTSMNWPLISPQQGIQWEIQATNYGNSATVQAYNQGTNGTESWLATPILDFSSSLTASVFFDFSYAYNGVNYDRLKILASTDCGNSYPDKLLDVSGPNMAITTSTVPWLPSSPSQWLNRYYINLNSYAGNDQVRFAFVFINARGNNAYLDNLEFFVSDDPNPVDTGDELFSVYWSSPNSASVTFNLDERSNINIQVFDILGRSYIDTSAPNILNQTFPVDLGGANSGIYLMRIQVAGRYYVSKFYLP
jgi:hypothetical protein